MEQTINDDNDHRLVVALDPTCIHFRIYEVVSSPPYKYPGAVELGEVAVNDLGDLREMVSLLNYYIELHEGEEAEWWMLGRDVGRVLCDECERARCESNMSAGTAADWTEAERARYIQEDIVQCPPI